MSKEAMKLALDALEWCHGGEPCGTAEAITALREALAEQPAYRAVKTFHEGKPVYVAEQPAQQEPWAWLFQHEETGLTQCVDTQQVEWGFEKNNPRWQKIAPLYTTPQAQRTWVGLTDEERHACTQSPFTTENFWAIEAKLKEKNT